VKDDFAMTIT